ncbi:MAG: peptide transporter ATP-binding protein [Clostridiaceae bacterium]|jgi:ABC-type dipeptide/oligopeptide/nickel transport system ATPase component|nr:peptide transporter ATP-binding protein [Clostridiaceae bacterium]
MQNLLFEMCNVEISYDSKTVVHNVNLKIKYGEILGIVGESGSGKSTLIKAAIGLLGNGGSINKGNVFYKGNNLLNMKTEELRKIRGPEMGMIFQNCEAALSPTRTIGSQLKEMMKQHTDMDEKEIINMANAFFQKMNLDGRRILKSYPFELSGGMNQRVGIVMAMMLKPDLLFADEPTSALDIMSQAQVVSELKKLRDEFGTAIVIVTHNIGIVSYMADKVAVMNQGNLIEYGETKDVINNPKQAYTKKLISAVPRIRKE